MKKIIILSFIALLAACTDNIKDTEKTIESADVAYDQFKLEKSRRILISMVLTDSLENEQKCKALRRLAYQDWKYYKDCDLARKRLVKADSVGVSKFDTWILLSRIERESRNFDNSIYASKTAIDLAKSVGEINSARIENAQVVYDFTISHLENNESVDSNLLNETTEMLSAILKSNAGMPKPSKLLLGISLLNNDGENVLKAWQSYFHIQDIQNTYSYLSCAAKELSQVCRGWNGNKLNLTQQERLITALASSRFYEFIPVYVKVNQNEANYNKRVSDIITYSNYLKEVKSKTDEYYRLIAIEEENERHYRNWLESRKKKLWSKLYFLSNKQYNKKEFLIETKKHFGARGFVGSTASYKGFNLCLGHIVNQETAKIEQYGYKPDFNYTQIDMMTSNTFPSWYWEDKASGGWATNNEIIRVREVYLSRPFIEWNSVTDSITKGDIEQLNLEFIGYDKNHDLLQQAKGLERKLNFDASTDLYNKLYRKGLRNNKLKLAFLSTFELYRMEATVFAHEGRHSIEKKFLTDEFENWDNEQRELHAKLSQIIFAAEPRYELAGMFSDIGESGHGKANKRIIEIALTWIENNKEKVDGFSEDKSVLSQIYLLSKDQIKESYLLADPMNK